VEARFSALVQTGTGAHSASYTMGTGSFPAVKRPGRGAAPPPPHLAPWLMEEYSYTSTPPLGVCGLFGGELYLYATYLSVPPDDRPRTSRGYSSAYRRYTSTALGSPTYKLCGSCNSCMSHCFFCKCGSFFSRRASGVPQDAEETGKPRDIIHCL
jgi:hypothetical protein